MVLGDTWEGARTVLLATIVGQAGSAVTVGCAAVLYATEGAKVTMRLHLVFALFLVTFSTVGPSPGAPRAPRGASRRRSGSSRPGGSSPSASTSGGPPRGARHHARRRRLTGPSPGPRLAPRLDGVGPVWDRLGRRPGDRRPFPHLVSRPRRAGPAVGPAQHAERPHRTPVGAFCVRRSDGGELHAGLAGQGVQPRVAAALARTGDGGGAGGDVVGRHVLGDDGVGADDGPVADRDPTEDAGPRRSSRRHRRRADPASSRRRA